MQNKGVWEKLAYKYDELWVQKYSLEPTRKVVMEILRFENKSFSMLDIGCGTGQLLDLVEKRFKNKSLVGIDKSKEMIAKAKEKGINADFYVSEAESFDLDSRFDIITCCHSFPYYSNQKLVLKKVSELLAKNGKAIFVQGSINNFYDKLAFGVVEMTAEKADYVSRKDFCMMAEENFVVEKVFKIKKKYYMPSIYGFVLRRK